MKTFWQSIVTFFTTNLYKIVMFLSILIIGLIVIKVILVSMRKVFAKSKLDKTLKTFVLSMTKFLLLLIYIITLCSVIGIPITSIVAIITALALAIGLALQSSISNVANGIILLATKPFKEGDYVEIGGTAGNVSSLKMLNTTLITPTNELVIIPNNQMSSAVIKNYTTEGKRRLDLLVSVEYTADIEQVKALLTALADNHSLVMHNEPVLVRLLACSSSSLDFTMRMWVTTPEYWNAKFDLQEKVVLKLRENNINIPYPTYDINIANNDQFRINVK